MEKKKQPKTLCSYYSLYSFPIAPKIIHETFSITYEKVNEIEGEQVTKLCIYHVTSSMLIFKIDNNRPKYKSKTIKPVKENIGDYFHNPRVGKDFFLGKM